jgi:hypothetical protein
MLITFQSLDGVKNIRVDYSREIKDEQDARVSAARHLLKEGEITQVQFEQIMDAYVNGTKWTSDNSGGEDTDA